MKNGEKKRRPMSNGKKVNIICLAVIAVLYTAVTLLNLVQKNRPTVSENENRNLASMPEFSFGALADGSYFRGLSEFISDTFWNRENLVDAAKKMDLLKGFDAGIAVIANPVEETTEEDDEEFWKRLESLMNEETTLPATSDVFTETEPPEIVSTEEITSFETETVPEETVFVPSFSLEKISVSVGSTASFTFEVKREGPDEELQPELVWDEPNSKIATITVKGNKVTVKGIAAGSTTVSLVVGENKATVSVDVFKPNVVVDPDAKDDLSNGIFMYQNMGFISGNVTAGNAQKYAAALEYYAKIFPNTRITALIAPVSSVIIDDPKITKTLPNQRAALNKMATYFEGKQANFVNLGETMYTHRSEYIYFKTDHHWTQLGAYYAYADFIRQIAGEEPVALDDMVHQTITTSYHGSYYRYTKDDRFKKIADTIDAWKPDVALTMTVTPTNAATYTRKSVIVASHKTYLCFIGGDNPYTVINVPENPQDKSILVFKDSYGDAFVPFLTAHYGNIFVIDPRHISMNVLEKFGDYGLSDIVFLNNIQCANQVKWINYYLKAAGK